MNVLSDLFQNIADAIRFKTGGTDTMAPTQFPNAIRGIEAGVPSDSFCTVTFCNYDGTILYQRHVVVGDDCPDPVKQGKIDTPTKIVDGESLTWTGWSKDMNSCPSSTILSNITEDKTLYAYFGLVGTLADVSWADISAASLNGTASILFKVGDTKAITLTNSDGTTEEVLVAIAGFNLHRNTNGTKDGITFIQKGHRAVEVSGKNGGAAINDTYDLLEEDLKAVIRKSRITSGDMWNGSSMSTVTNDQYLFSPELTNLSTSLTGESGETNPAVKDYYGNYVTTAQYTNSYDAGLFPLFSGMTKAQLGQFLELTEAGIDVVTRTMLYFTKSGVSMAVPARISYSPTYSLYKWGKTSTLGGFQFCFRV